MPEAVAEGAVAHMPAVEGQACCSSSAAASACCWSFSAHRFAWRRDTRLDTAVAVPATDCSARHSTNKSHVVLLYVPRPLGRRRCLGLFGGCGLFGCLDLERVKHVNNIAGRNPATGNDVRTTSPHG